MFQHATIDVPNFREIFDTFLTNIVFKVLRIVGKDGIFSFGAFQLLVI